jgi:uncharacterized protein
MNLLLISGLAQTVDITAILICIGVGLLIGLITVLVMKGQLKSVRPKDAATEYVVAGSFQLRGSRDIFLYRHVRRTARPKNNK